MVVVNQWLNVTTNTKEDRHCVRLRDTRNASNMSHIHTITHNIRTHARTNTLNTLLHATHIIYVQYVALKVDKTLTGTS